MRTLRPSSDLLTDADRLRARFRDDGYLYFPGLLDPAPLEALRTDILRAIEGCGWLQPGTDLLDGIPSEPPRWHGMDRRGDTVMWRDGYVAVQRLESFHRQTHDPRVLAVVRDLVGEDDILVHGQRIARIIWPQDDITTNPHQDYTYIQGSPDFVTTWVPLADCPAELGGLRILVGSHTEGVRPLRATSGGKGTGAFQSDVDDDDPAWATADWKRGDVVLFHSLTVHGGTPNRSGRLRISVDYRYQSAKDPVAANSLRPHNSPYVPDWPELLAPTGWSSYEWVDRVGDTDGLTLADFHVGRAVETFHEEIGARPASRFLEPA